MAIFQVVDQDGQKVLVEVPVGSDSIATEEAPGVVQPDGKTVSVDNTGVLSAIGGNLLLNSEAWITESGTWTAPVTGWYEVLLIGGGYGAVANKGTGPGDNFLSSGSSGGYKQYLMFFSAGDNVPVTIGAGGLGTTGSSTSPTRDGGVTSFGDKSTAAGGSADWHGFQGVTRYQANEGIVVVSGAGFGGGPASLNASSINGRFYGAGSGAGISYVANPVVEVAGNGKQGAVRLRWHDPAKANGPTEQES